MLSAIGGDIGPSWCSSAGYESSRIALHQSQAQILHPAGLRTQSLRGAATEAERCAIKLSDLQFGALDAILKPGGAPVKRVVGWIIACMLLPSAVMAQRGMGACCGAGPVMSGSSPVELKGKVARVQITPGEGMPFVTVRSGDQSVKLYLGSMRYLMAQGFNPKLGDDIAVKAFNLNSDFVAVTVTLPSENKTIRLRDDAGRPLWRGGMRGPMR
jgi:hypothetical protein